MSKVQATVPSASLDLQILFVWTKGRTTQELRSFRAAEVAALLQCVAPEANATLAPFAASLHGCQLAWLQGCGSGVASVLQYRSALISAALQILACAPSLELAAHLAIEDTLNLHDCYIRVLGSQSNQSSIVDAVRYTQQRLRQLGIGVAPNPCARVLWCLYLPDDGISGGSQVLLALQLPAPACTEAVPKPKQHATEPQTASQGPGLQAAGQTASGAARQQNRQHQQALTVLQKLQADVVQQRQEGPTSMQSVPALLTANLAQIKTGGCVLDPFAGSGRLLQACAAVGASHAMGCEIIPHRVQPKPWCGCLIADASHTAMWRANAFDAVVADPPYGAREYGARQTAKQAGVEGSGMGVTEIPAASASLTAGAPAVAPASSSAALSSIRGQRLQSPSRIALQEQHSLHASPSWQATLQSLLSLSAHVLAPAGLLVTWLPHSPDPGYEHQLRDQGAQHGLELQTLLAEQRRSGLARGVASFRKGPCSQTCQPRLPHAALPMSPRQAANSLSAGPKLEQDVSVTEPKLGPEVSITEPKLALHVLVAEPKLHPGGLMAKPKLASHDLLGPSGPSTGSLLMSQPNDMSHGHLHQAPLSGATAAAAEHSRRTSQAKPARLAMDASRAAWRGDMATLKGFLKAGGDVDLQDVRGQTLLQFAAGFGRTSAVQLLLEAGADVSASADPGSLSALHRAAGHGHSECVQLLLEHGAQTPQLNTEGQTALFRACMYGHCDIVQQLLAAATRLQMAKPHTADCRLQHSALNDIDTSGQTALHYAARWGYPQVVGILLLQGRANPDQVDPQGYSAAHVAAQWGHTGVLSVLHEHKADFSLLTSNGLSVRQIADEWSRKHCSELLQRLQLCCT